jgi:hypothetical protein
MGLLKNLVAEVADLVVIVILRVLVVMVVMVDYPQGAEVRAQTLVLLLAALAETAATV